MSSTGNVTEARSPVPKSAKMDEASNSTVLKPSKALVDHFEVMVDHMKQQALQLEQEREFLLTSLESFVNGNPLAELDSDERKEAEEQLNRVIEECMSVSVKVEASRTHKEEEALDHINFYINNLVVNVSKDPSQARHECLDAIRSIVQEKLEDAEKECDKHRNNTRCKGCRKRYKFVQCNTNQPRDESAFGVAHASLSFDDQRRTLRRLRGLMSYIHSLQREAVQMLEE